MDDGTFQWDDAKAAGATPAFLDRLALDRGRVAAMADGLDVIRKLTDPIGAVMASWRRPNGMRIERVRVPLGVVGVIYESRPNVTADAGALCLKAGNAVLLRGGSESFHSARAIHAALVQGLNAAGLPADAIQLVPTRDRAAVGLMLTGLDGTIDVIVPRGGKSLVGVVQSEARVPVFAHLEGVCHVYVDGAARLTMAKEIVLNAKMRRTGICGATETLLIDAAIAPKLLPLLVADLRVLGCDFRADAVSFAVELRIAKAVTALVALKFFFGGQPAGRPAITMIMDVEVAPAAVKGHVIVAVAREPPQARVFIEGVAAGGVGDQGKKVF